MAGVSALVAVLGLSAPVQAGPEPWEKKARVADLVVVGECEQADSHWEDGAIYTHSLIRVNEHVRGPSASWITVRQRGGTVGNIGQRVTHERLVEPGQSYLLFLRETPVGMWEAGAGDVVPVRSGPDGEKRVAGEVLKTVVGRLGAVQ